MRHFLAIFHKQLIETFKNKTILIQFIMFPALTVIMENAIKIDGMPAHYFANLFAVMYVGMAPLTSMASIISEEKEKNTLRVLLLSNVHPLSYLLGTGCYIWIICMIGATVIGLSSGYTGITLFHFLIVMAVGILISILIGAAIGTRSKNQMTATSVTVPVMMIFSFLPMLAMFNDTISKVAKVTYSQQISLLLSDIENVTISTQNTVIILINIALTLTAFLYAYRRFGLE